MSVNEPNKVIQTNNIVEGDIAGGDIIKNSHVGNIVNVYLSGPQDYRSLIALLGELTQVPEEFISILIKENNEEKYGYQTLEKSLNLLKASKASLFSDVFGDITKIYENILLGSEKDSLDEEYFKSLIKIAAVCIKKLEFDKAHQFFKDALGKIKQQDSIYNLIYKEYLITGFIHYSRQNDMAGLRSLLNKAKIRKIGVDDEIDHIVANLFQEVCSRDTDLGSLQHAVNTIEGIYKKASGNIKLSMANSLGLAYRRLGERTSIENLEKASGILREGLMLNVNDMTMEIQLKDNLGITLIRLFEFTHSEMYLDEAEELLTSCLNLLSTIRDPRDCMIKPRVINNLGNVFKQRILFFDDLNSARAAIGYYEEAEKIWTEANSAYEWGILRKNMGETKYALARVTNDPRLLLEALDDCIASMKYRDITNSPFQWAKSVEIIFMIVLVWADRKYAVKITTPIRNKILGFIKIVDANSTKWSPENFEKFSENAVKVRRYLTQNKR